MKFKHFSLVGSGCGKVGGTVASVTRDLRFDSSHRQYYLLSTLLKSCIPKTEIKKKRPEMGQLQNHHYLLLNKNLYAKLKPLNEIALIFHMDQLFTFLQQFAKNKCPK